jgi:hypothetical protein
VITVEHLEACGNQRSQSSQDRAQRAFKVRRCAVVDRDAESLVLHQGAIETPDESIEA